MSILAVNNFQKAPHLGLTFRYTSLGSMSMSFGDIVCREHRRHTVFVWIFKTDKLHSSQTAVYTFYNRDKLFLTS